MAAGGHIIRSKEANPSPAQPAVSAAGEPT